MAKTVKRRTHPGKTRVAAPKLKRVHHHPPEPEGDYEPDTPGMFA